MSHPANITLCVSRFNHVPSGDTLFYSSKFINSDGGVPMVCLPVVTVLKVAEVLVLL